MGGWMTYQRARNRNGLVPGKPDDDPDPYWRTHPTPAAERWRGSWPMIVGDLDRMERDYLAPRYPQPPAATRSPGSDPAAVCAAAVGVDVEVVRAVLRHVFRSVGGA